MGEFCWKCRVNGWNKHICWHNNIGLTVLICVLNKIFKWHKIGLIQLIFCPAIGWQGCMRIKASEYASKSREVFDTANYPVSLHRFQIGACILNDLLGCCSEGSTIIANIVLAT